jgi:hypothetical protein
MTPVGQYDATYEGVDGDLFVYGESPVTSAKLNRWHGNIDAGFWLLHRLLRILAAGDGAAYLVGEDGDDPFRVEERSTPGMTVKVAPGFALGPEYAIGLSAEASLPATGSFTAPTSNPRIDAVGVRQSGEWVVDTGTESSSPVAPTLGVDTVPLADIYFRVGSTSIKTVDDGVNAYVIDTRPRRISAFGHRHTGPVTPSESTDGSRTNFSTADRFVAGTLRVSVNGLLQLPTTHYTEDADKTGYTFSQPPPAGYSIHHEYQPG